MDFFLAVQLHFTIGLFKKYNYETEKVEPVDLTGCKIRGSIYKPKLVFEFEITDNTTGETFMKEIALSDEESQQYALLSSDKEIEEFRQVICNNHKNEIQDALREFEKIRNDQSVIEIKPES